MLTAPQLARQAEPPFTTQSSNNSPIWLGEARGLAHLHLSVSWVDSMGGGPPPPFPAHQLCWQVQASKGLPLHPIHAHQHIWWTQAGRRVPRALERRGQAHFYPGWGLGCTHSHSLSWRVGGRHGFPVVPLSDRKSPFTHIESVTPLAVHGSCLGHLGGDLDRHMKACREQRAES